MSNPLGRVGVPPLSPAPTAAWGRAFADALQP